MFIFIHLFHFFSIFFIGIIIFSFLALKKHADLFRGLPFIDNVIPFDKRNTHKGFSGLLKFAKLLSEYNFDLIVDLHLSIRSTTLFSFVKKSYIVGFSSAVMSYLFNARVEKKQELNEVERNLMILSLLCTDFSLDEAKKLGGSLECFIDKDIKNNTITYFKSVSQNKIAGIAPGSVWPTKRWPVEYFSETAKSLYEKGYNIALFGGKDDIESLNEFKKLFPYPFFDFACKTSLKELPAILSAVDILIVNDSGAMHIAVAGSVPAVAIFGPTVKSLGFFPYDDKSIVVENNNINCRPCGSHGGVSCPKKHFKCMKDIPPQIVIDSACKLLKG